MNGWNNLIDSGASIGDASFCMIGVVIMFIIPKDPSFFSGKLSSSSSYEALLNWKFVQSHVPWGVALLLGGGLALSAGAEKSGLSQWIGKQLAGVESLPSPVILIIVMLVTSCLTEICSYCKYLLLQILFSPFY